MFLKKIVDNAIDNISKIHILAIIMLFTGSIAQAGMLYFFLNADFSKAFLSHIIAALLFPWPIWLLISSRYHKSNLIIILFFLLCFFIPLIASLGLLLAVSLGSYYSKNLEKKNFTFINIPNIPDGIIKHIAYVQTMGSNIRSVLEYSIEPQERMRAILATRRMNNQEAIPILQIALLDPIDEIRLLAYSMLNNKEKKISAAIQSNLNSLAEDSTLSLQEKATKYHYVAESYWELAYLGLEQGQAKIHVLKAANYYVTEALKVYIADSELYFLSARISLELAQYEQAKENFNMATQCGMSKQKLAPYQAELAFAERRFDDVRFYMQQAKYTAEKNTLSDMVKQWL